MSYTFSFQFGVMQTYIFYITIVFLATLFAALSQRYAVKVKNKPIRVNKFFWFLSFIILAIPLGFRGSGIDNEGYLQIYNVVKDTGISGYNGFPEPLFMLLNYLIIRTVDNLQYVFMVSGFTSIFFIYMTLARKAEELNLALMVWILCFSFYFYMYGLVRISIAISIMTFAINYLEKKDIKKYFFWSITAGLFHYSTLILVPIFYLIEKRRMNLTKKINLLKITIVVIVGVPLTFLLGVELFTTLFSNFAWFGRYNAYFNSTTINLGSIKGMVWTLPILFIILNWGDYIERRLKHYGLYVNIFGVMLSFTIISIFFGTQRFTYFMYPICFYLYASVLSLPFVKVEKNTVLFLYWMAMIIFGLLWMLVVVLGGENWKPHMVPYHFNIP